MSVNARVIINPHVNPQLALKWALSRLRKQCGPVMRAIREKEFFVSDKRKRREERRKAEFERRASQQN